MDNTIRFDVNSAQLVICGRVHWEELISCPAHVHYHWEFIYVVRGTGRIDLPDASVKPQAYHLVAYPPGLLHSEVSSTVDPEETIFLGIDVPVDYTAGTHLLLPDPDGELGWLCERIVSEFEASGTSTLANMYSRAFLCLVERVWKCAVPIRHDAVDVAVQFMQANYARQIDLQDLARAASVTGPHLVHRFTAKMGISPMRYLQQIRINAAKRMLATGNLSINEVAARTGFNDPLYFSRVFKRLSGSSPKIYRQQANCRCWAL